MARPREQFSIVATVEFGLRAVVVATQAPRMRETKWDLGGYASDRVLSFPAMLFGAWFFAGSLDDLYAFFITGPYDGLQTRLYRTVLPNANDLGWVCLGNDAEKDALIRRTAALRTWEEKTEAVLDSFWSTHFSDHVIERLTTKGPLLHRHLASLAAWESGSRREPNFVSQVRWEYAGTAGEFIHRQVRS